MGLQSDRVIVVTGASRSAGKGIALGLAPGATVYVTGRTARSSGGSLTVEDTADEINRLGGKGIPVIVDHNEPEQVKALFDQVAKEQGRLDILVNNAFQLVGKEPGKAGFWEQPLEALDMVRVGMMSDYVASYYAAPLLVKNGEGLVVNTSAPAGRVYTMGPAFGGAHAGGDKIAHDMAVDFRKFNVASLTIWLGLLKNENAQVLIANDPDGAGAFFKDGETCEFTGLLIDALAKDPKLMEKTGKVFWGAELGEEYGIKDLDGRQPASNRGWLGPPTEYGEVELMAD